MGAVSDPELNNGRVKWGLFIHIKECSGLNSGRGQNVQVTLHPDYSYTVLNNTQGGWGHTGCLPQLLRYSVQ